MESAEKLYIALRDEFGFENAKGSISFNLNNYQITVEQNNVIGNILEEWLDKWMTHKGIDHIHNEKQASPDFWLNTKETTSDWLEVKSFTGSPNFDVAAFRSFINLIIEKPWKLHSKHLLIKYKSEKGVVTIENFWLKNLWEICCTSSVWPIKVQYKNNVIVNIRPSTWYSDKADYPSFDCLEDFLAALEETIYKYHDTRSTIAENWSKRLCESYKKHYQKELILPRWNDVKNKYVKE
ncbi:MAG: NgoBV family restriction endonuclease [Paludibacteraceae bacterium]|nr:NgoBV family restriction endonuclease [Paludibacteraceae bacterium]